MNIYAAKDLKLEPLEALHPYPTRRNVPRTTPHARCMPLRDPTSPKLSYLPPGHTAARLRARGAVHPSPEGAHALLRLKFTEHSTSPLTPGRDSSLSTDVPDAKRLRTRSESVDLRDRQEIEDFLDCTLVPPGSYDDLDLLGKGRQSSSSALDMTWLSMSNDASSSSTTICTPTQLDKHRRGNSGYSAEEEYNEEDSLISDCSSFSSSVLDDADILLLRLATASLELRKIETDLLTTDSTVASIESRLAILQQEVSDLGRSRCSLQESSLG